MKISKIILLAAGEGSRMYPFSMPKNPKILLPFLGKPLLAWQLESFVKKGFKDFVIVCNPKNKTKIEKYFYNYTSKQIKINYAVQSEQLGPSHALWCARKFFTKDDYLLFKYADSVADSDQITPLVKIWKKYPQEAVITLKKIDNPAEYGVVKFEKLSARDLRNPNLQSSGYITQIIEKPEPEQAPSNFAVIGLGILQAGSFLKGIGKDNLFKGKKEVVPQEYVLRQHKKAGWWIYQGKSIDLGRPWNVLEVNKLFIDLYGEKIFKARHCQSTKAQISKKAYISPSAVINKGCIIGNYSSIDSAEINANTQIKNSYIMPGAKIGENSYIESSVIGRNARIGKNFKTKTKAKKNIKVLVKGKLQETNYKSLGCFIGSGIELKDNFVSQPGEVVL